MAEHTATLQVRMPAELRGRLTLVADEIGLREAAVARNALRIGLDVIAAAARETDTDLPLEAGPRDITDPEKWRVTAWEPVEA